MSHLRLGFYSLVFLIIAWVYGQPAVFAGPRALCGLQKKVQSNEPEIPMDTLLQSAVSAYRKTNFEISERLFLQALDRMSLPEDEVLYLKTLNNLGKVYFQVRRYARLDSLSRLLVQLTQDRDEPDYLLARAEVLSFLAILQDVKNKPDSALLLLQESKDISEALGKWNGYQVAVVNMAAILTSQGKHNEAVAVLSEGRFLLEKAGIGKHYIARLAYRLGRSYMTMMDHEMAIGAFKESMAISLELEDLALYTRSRLELAWVYLSKGDMDNVHHHAQLVESTIQVDTLKQLLGDQRLLLYLYQIKLAYYVERAMPDSAGVYEKKLTGVLQSNNNRHLSASVNGDLLYNLGKYYFMVDEFEKARFALTEALRLFAENRNTQSKAHTMSLLAKVTYALGEYKLAYEHFKTSSEMLDSIFSVEEARELGRVESEVELLQKEKDIAAQKERSRYLSGLVAVAAIISAVVGWAYLVKRRLGKQLTIKNNNLSVALKQLEDTQRQVVALDRLNAVGRLYAGLAHEIKNPLTFVQGGIDAIESYWKTDPNHPRDPEPRRDQYIGVVKRGVSRALGVLERIKSYAHVADHQVSEDINELLEQVTGLVSTAKSVKIRTDFTVLPRLSYGNGQLSQVFMNLMVNAIDALQDQGEVLVRTRLSSDEIVVTITDNGTGMDAGTQARLFEPFFTTKPAGEGLGLGLHISQTITASYGGTITGHSEGLGKGSTFEIRLPLSKDL